MSMSDDTRLVLDALDKLEQSQAQSLDQISERIAKLEGVLLGSMGPPRDPGALARIEAVEGEVHAMRDEQRWLRRTLVGSIIAGAMAIIGALVVAALNVPT